MVLMPVRWDSPVSSGHGHRRPGGTYCGAGVLDASPFRTPLRVAQHWPRPGIDSTRAPATLSAEGLTHGHERPGRAQGQSSLVPGDRNGVSAPRGGDQRANRRVLTVTGINLTRGGVRLGHGAEGETMINQISVTNSTGERVEGELSLRTGEVGLPGKPAMRLNDVSVAFGGRAA